MSKKHREKILRSFIRESYLKKNSLTEGWVEDWLMPQPTGTNYGNYPSFKKSMGQELHDLVNPPDKNPLEGSLIDKKFSLEYEEIPDFVVRAENKAASLLIVQLYSRSAKEPEQVAATLSGQAKIIPTRAKLKRANDTKMIEEIDRAITQGVQKYPALAGQIPVDASSKPVSKAYGQWEFSDIPESDGSSFVGNLISEFNAPFLGNTRFILVPRELKYLTKPSLISTERGKKMAEEFECVLPVTKVVNYAFSKPFTSPEWALSAACFFDYANSMKLSLLAGAVGFLMGGPGGAVMGMASTDAINRIPVMIWSVKAGKTSFFVANCVYFAVNFYGGKIGQSFIKNSSSEVKKKIYALVFWLIDNISSFIPDVQIALSNAKNEAIEMLEDESEIQKNLDQSDAALREYLRSMFPRI